MSDAGSATALGVKVAEWSWDHRGAVAKKLNGIFRYFRKRHDVLILGAGGTGKSTVSKLLSGEYHPLLDATKHYEESMATEVRSLKPERRQKNGEIVTPPGQQHRRESTWTAQYRKIAEGKYRGVILLSSYGYRSPLDREGRENNIVTG